MRVSNAKRFAIVSFLAGVLATAFVVVAVVLLGKVRILTAAQYDNYMELKDNFSKYNKVEQYLDKEAYYSSDSDIIDEYFMTGLMKSLKDDKYAQYMDASTYSQMERRLFDSYVGIGVGVKETDNGVEIVSVSQDGPAEEAGLEIGDIITEVDGKQIKTGDAAVDAISGKQGTKVKLTITRSGKKKSFTIYRSEIDDNSVSYKVYKDDIGYIAISAFSKGTSDKFETAVKDLKAQGCTKLIIDLRDNGGGVTKEGIKVADMLLPECEITSCHYKDKSKDKVENSDASDIGCEYVLLVNGNTASASEIVTSAVQDNDGGTVIGTRTYGKGLIQNVRSFKDGTAIKYTVGEYRSPDNHKINGKGIKPDIEATGSDVLAEAVKSLS